MNRKVLLVEPKYKNKYPPLGLMKIATYHKKLGDEVVFFKGSFKDFIVEEIYKKLISKLYVNNESIDWVKYDKSIRDYIVKGLHVDFDRLCEIGVSPFVASNLKYYRDYYVKKKYLDKPHWDRICISTLFTFYWKETIEAINCFKGICKSESEVWVGGVAASVVPDEVYSDTGIRPHIGLLDRPSIMDDNEIIIDHLPLDYSILNEIDYIYPENNGYYGHTTRGCVNKCSYCAVPTIEPYFKDYVNIKEQICHVKECFGEKQNLLLLDNNVLASKQFDRIIEDIKDSGFTNDSKYIKPNEYTLTIKGLKSGINDAGYTNRIVKLYKKLLPKLGRKDKKMMYDLLMENKLTNKYTATKENIFKADKSLLPLFIKHHSPIPTKRIVDFNQGIDASLLTEEKAKKIAEIPINPLRIAFDSWSQRNIYEKAIRHTAKSGIKNMSNYLLYNYKDKPIDLYRRLKLNVDLCEELDINIYSFPMKYHPIKDANYFKERSYISKYWNRKFIRTIQAILNATKGKVGRGLSFFEEAFGKNEHEFTKLLYMPETLIVYRFYFKEKGITDSWWADFCALNDAQKNEIRPIIHSNSFLNIESLSKDDDILKVLKYYKITRDDADVMIKHDKLIHA